MRKLTLATLLSGALLCFSTAYGADETNSAASLQNINTRINCGDHEAVLSSEHFKRLAYSINRLKTRNEELTTASGDLVHLNDQWVNAVVGCIKEDAASCSSLAILPQQIYQTETSINRMVAVQHQLRMQIFSEPSRIALRACSEQRGAPEGSM